MPNTTLDSGRMPLLFVGHGSPMNAIEENEFVDGFRQIGLSMSKPKAIVCVSAHWETLGTSVTAMEKPETIHDFEGFPQALFAVQYTAPGSPELAARIQNSMSRVNVELDFQWGLDHGTWSVVKHLYPLADVPIVQISLNRRQGADYHYRLLKELSNLRREGILIMASGNMVHNLRRVDWANPLGGYDWALKADETFKELIQQRQHQKLIHYQELGPEIGLSIPTSEHYLPMLCVLGLQEADEAVTFFNEKVVLGSISMTSFKVG